MNPARTVTCAEFIADASAIIRRAEVEGPITIVDEEVMLLLDQLEVPNP